MLRKILVADKHIFFCITMQAYLEKNRRNFVGFCCEKENFHLKFKEQKPDILILEYAMFNRKTFKLIENIKKENDLIKIIVVSSNLSKSLHKTLVEEGVDACLKKPFSETEFISIIDELIKNK